ncbi:hypothetical protein ABTD49_20730, partial [Acinetobacter baumannii]
QVQRQAVDLASWIEARCQAHAELAERQQVRLVSAIDAASFGGSLATSALDPVQMARAVDNRLLNALAHCTAGGHIALGARLRE